MLTILPGDCRQTLAALPAQGVQCCVTSPPYYGLRDYGCAGQIGLEQTPEAFVAEMVAVFREVRRVLREDGTLWLNLGDSYSTHAAGRCKDPMKTSGLAGVKSQDVARAVKVEQETYRNSPLPEKNLIGIPWRVAFALQADGWILRSDIIWHKPNPMPESITDRPTKSHEYLFLFAKSARYFYDANAIAEKAVSDHDSGNSFQGRQGGAAHMPMSGGQGGPEWTRPQTARARELAATAGLTQSHFDAIRACGLGDAGKNAVTQTGTGRNDPTVQALADEAKAALGGYYREFLLPNKRNKRSVWTVSTKPYRDAHFATFPPKLIEPCTLAGSRAGDTILDPFAGSGTTGMVAIEHGRRAILCELNPAYCDLIRQRCDVTPGLPMESAAAHPSRPSLDGQRNAGGAR